MKFRVAKTVVINKQVKEVVNALKKEGLEIIELDHDKVLLKIPDSNKPRIENSRYN